MGNVFFPLKFNNIKRLKNNICDRFYFSLDDETYLDEVKKQVFKTLPEKYGAGVDLTYIKKAISSAYKAINKKYKSCELFENERWLFENNYLFLSELDKKSFDEFFRLPHIGSEPRIVSLARFVLTNSGFEINEKRITSFIKEQNDVQSLTYSEICNLPDAFSYVLLEKISVLSEKCLLAEDLRLLSKSKSSFRLNALSSAVFRYFLGENSGFNNSDKLKFLMNTVSVNLTRSISKCVTSLHKISQLNFVASYKPLNYLDQDFVFKNMADVTKHAYLEKIAEESDQINTNEVAYTKKLIELAKYQGVHFGKLLFEHSDAVEDYIKKNSYTKIKENKSDRVSQAIYVVSYFLLLLSFVAGIGFILGFYYLNILTSVFAAILSFFALMPVTLDLINILSGLFVKNRPILKMNSETVPQDAMTYVVVSEFISKPQTVNEAVEKFNAVKALNEDGFVKFVMLIDTKPSDEEFSDTDKNIVEALKSFKDLNFLVRKKVLIGGKYRAYERKRGAIETLTNALYSGDFSAFSYVSNKLEKAKYLVLLDDDSVLEPHSVREAVNTMIHPLNSKYDLMSFECRINLNSLTTKYSYKFADCGGREIYCGFSNLYFNMFGKAIFCGKGIVRLDSYIEKILNKLPENRILSHDALEGAILNSGSLPECVYEDAPTSFKSELTRTIRWQRGDVQNLPFVCSKKFKMSCFYRFMLLLNGLRPLQMLSIFIILVLSAALLSVPLALVAAILFFAPYALDLISLLLKGSKLKFNYLLFSALKTIWKSIVALIILPFTVFISTSAFLTSLIRMMTGKKLLEWKTFRDLQSNEADTKSAVSKSNEKKLTRYAKDFYRYFEDNIVDGLVADHYQKFLDKGRSDYTSSTNIGFSMLTHIAAAELNFITKDEAKKRIFNTLDSVSKLKKWHGHLYNWYSLETKTPLSPNFVSSVDSGNFVASLFVLKGYFKDEKDIISKVDQLINNTDFSFLFDRERGQFFIGYNGYERKYEGHYDMLASEARILSIIGVAFGLPLDAWNNLSRRHTSGLHSTLYSWSGTCFEYLLSDLFLDAPKFSMLRQSSVNSVREQIKARCGKYFGISESSYFAFDENNNFQYKAFGINKISLSPERESCVISPYSSFLALPHNETLVMRNLQLLEKFSSEINEQQSCAYGKYGFIESIDFSKCKEGKCVTTYMSHHQAMALLAILNRLKDNILQKCFYSDEKLIATKILLTEPKIKTRGFKKPKTKRLNPAPYKDIHFEHIEKPMLFPKFNFGGNRYSVLIDDFGQGYSSCGGVMMNRFRPSIFKPYGMFVYAVENGECYSPTFAPLKNNEKYTADFFLNKSVFNNASRNFSQEVFTSSLISGELRKFTLKSQTNTKRKIKIAFYADLCLNRYEADIAHQTFSNLMVRTDFDLKRNVIYAERKTRENEKSMFCALVVNGFKSIVPITSKFDFIGRNRNAQNPIILEKLKNSEDILPSLHDVLEPCLGFTAELICENIADFSVAMVYSLSKTELEKLVNEATSPSFCDLMAKTGAVSEISENMERYFRAILPKIQYLPPSVKSVKRLKKLSDELSTLQYEKLTDRVASERDALALASEFKIIYYKYSGNLTMLKELGIVMERFKNLGLPVMLIVAYDEEDTYYESIKKTLSDFLSKGNFKLIRYFHDMWREAAFLEVTDKLDVVVSEEFFEGDNYKKQIENELALLPSINGGKYLGNSSFTNSGNFALNNVPLLPYSNVMCLKRGGAISTENGGGFTFFDNSRENKLTQFYQDTIENGASEKLTAIGEDWFSSLNQNCQTNYGIGFTEQNFASEKFKATVTQYMILNGGAKVVEVVIKDLTAPFSLVFSVEPAIGESGKNYVFHTKNYHDTVVLTNLKNGSKMYLRALFGRVSDNLAEVFSRITNSPVLIKSNLDIRGAAASIEVEKEGVYRFLIGADETIISLQRHEIEEEKTNGLDFFKNLSPFKIRTPYQSLDTFFNKWLPYQIVSSRFFGRCGYYQTGGAIGFRDQLQDSLAVMKMNPSLARDMILNCAAHQYLEGDVMHWWHGDRHGVRTRISDDKLFLPFVVCEYMKWTKDSEILNENIPYLISRPLNDGKHNRAARENDRYELPNLSKEKFPLIDHMERAVQNAMNFGPNGLLLIGSGDWNDAINDAGDDENGESVWLSMFAAMVLEKMAELYEGASRESFLNLRKKLGDAIEKCFSSDRYKRLVTKDGEWIGESSSRVKIDLISQSFASLSNICDKDRVAKCLDTAWCELVDEEYGLVKLLKPPVEYGLGYISSYPLGVRENGGQYSHAAVWYALALLNENRADEAFEILMMMNPIEKFKDGKVFEKYKGEPFVLAADIYTSEQHYGRAGWSWYTGSAAWYYNTVLELFGVKLSGKTLTLTPKIPSLLDGSKVVFDLFGTQAEITFRKTGRKKLFVNGAELTNVTSLELGGSAKLNIEVHC